MNKWRLLDTGARTAAENMALDETLLECKSRGVQLNAPTTNTIRFLQFYPSAVLVGYHQSVEQEVRVDFCKQNGIDINRRITGGGAIYFDETQLGWEVICEKSFFKVGIAEEAFFKNLCQPVIYGLQKLGIEADFRPRNDIEVNGRKISGTGGTEEGNAFLFQGTLLVDFDVDAMIRALRIPTEKLKAKELNSVRERVTCVKWELGEVPGINYLKEVLKEGFEQEFGIELVESGLTKEESALFHQKIEKFKSEEWVYKIKEPAHTRQVVCSIYKAKGGLIRPSLVVNLRRQRLESAFIMGDFFAFPKRTIFDLESALKDIRADKSVVESKIINFFKQGTAEVPDISPQDFVKAVNEALDKVKIADFGIPLSLANRIFTVNGTFPEIIKKRPSALLLPYCSKFTECEFRYKRECTECGKCSVGEAYTTGKTKNIWTTTIISFEDLMLTLEHLKSKSVSSYIGCCCEPFYAKHREELEEAELAGILIDIDNTTCYDLGKEREAYKGQFENQTELNIDLLKEVINAI